MLMFLCYNVHMPFRRSRNAEPAAYAHEVLEALEKTQLDPETTLVMGGSALALAGLRRAGDLDLLVPYFSTYRRLEATRKLPSGVPLQNKVGAHHPFLETVPVHVPRGMLAVDITHPHDTRHHQPSPELDQEFLRKIADFEHIQGFPVMPLELVLEHKEQRTGFPSRKDRQDMRAIRERLQQKDRN